jgi:hypothetical protein
VNGNFKINSTVFFKSSFLFLRFGVEALWQWTFCIEKVWK